MYRSTRTSSSLPGTTMMVSTVLLLVLCLYSANGDYIRSRREPPSGYPAGPPRSSYRPPKPRYGLPPKPVYGPPKPKYGPPKIRYGPPKPNGHPKPVYGPPKPVYGPPKRKYVNPPKSNFRYQYSPPRKHHPKYNSPPKTSYGPPKTSYGPPSTSYGVPIQKQPAYSPQDVFVNSPVNTFDAPISISDNYGPPKTYSSFASKPSTSYGAPSTYNSYNSQPANSFPVPSTTYGIPSPTYGAPQAPAIASASSHNPVATSYINVYKSGQVSTDNYGAPTGTRGSYDTLSSSSNQQAYQTFPQSRYPQQQYQETDQSSEAGSREDDIITSASQNANAYNLQKSQDTYTDDKRRGLDQSAKLSTSIRFPSVSASQEENDASEEESSQYSKGNKNVQMFGSFQPPSQTFGFVPYDESKQKGGRDTTFSISPSQGYYAGSSVSSEVLPANYFDSMNQQHYSQRAESQSNASRRTAEDTKQSVRFPENDSQEAQP